MGTLPPLAHVGHEVGLGRLRILRPVRAHGMALALLLLTDTGRPLFGSGTERELSDAIMQARARLDAPAIEDAW